MKKILIIPVIILLSSCLKEEEAIDLPAPGNVSEDQVALGGDYRYQIYYSLESAEFVGQNFKTDWDLGFECISNGWHVVLNSSKLMKAVSTGRNDFETIKDTSGFKGWQFDGITGHLDSTAIGNWEKIDSYYLIDRGVDERGKHQGFGKIKIVEANDESFLISYGMLEDEKPHELVIMKDPSLNFKSFTFEEGGKTVGVEPAKKDWDLLFTQYTESLFDGSEHIPYLVTGAQINRFNTTCTLVKDAAFEDISLKDVENLNFESRIDQPGYNWKYFDFEESVYTVLTQNVYIIQNQTGKYYKLRFIDFYDEAGEKGSPTFEFQAL